MVWQLCCSWYEDEWHLDCEKDVSVTRALYNSLLIMLKSFLTNILLRHRSIVFESRVRLAFLLQLQNFTRRRRHLRALRYRIVLLEIVCHLLHRHPLHALMFVDVFDDPVYR
jgi:hypothetical protein